MPNLKPYAKAVSPYWMARKAKAKSKYAQAAAALQLTPAPDQASTSETILVFSSMGIFGDHLVVDALLARALERQGARVVIVLCDSQMAACHVTDRYSMFAAIGPAGRRRRQKTLCANCFGAASPLTETQLTYTYFSVGIQYFKSHQIADAEIDLTDEINSGIIRYAASSHTKMLEAVPQDIKKHYCDAADSARRAIEGLIAKYQPSRIIAHHGIYVPQGVIQKISNSHNITFYSWHFGYRKSTLIFSRGDTYHRELVAPQPAAFSTPLDDGQREQIGQYLKSRSKGSQDWIHFNRTPKPFKKGSASKGYFVFYTSVDWDAALHFPSSVFKSQFDCLSQLIELFRNLQAYDLVVRVHPAEVTGFHPAAFSIEDHLKTLNIPSNVTIVGAKDPTSSYDLARDCVAALVYNTKLGIELPPVGIPTIVMGDCWIRGKGFSYDVTSVNELATYISAADSLTVTAEQRERALQFAYYFYWRRCISTPELAGAGPKFQITVDSERWVKGQSSGTGMAFAAARIMAGAPVEEDR